MGKKEEVSDGMVKYGFTLPEAERRRRQHSNETISPESIVPADSKERCDDGVSADEL